MEVALAVAVTVGPIALILLLLLRTVRRRPSRRVQTPPAGSGPFRGRGGRGRAGDRSPTRPRVPSLSGGAALDVPIDDDPFEDPLDSAPRLLA